MNIGKSESATVPATVVDNGSTLSRLPYSRPSLHVYGSVAELTMGSGGTCPDGTLLDTQMSEPASGVCSSSPSDRNIKENVARIGEHPIGIGLYLFDYKPEFRDANGHGRQFGVMADEVETIVPEAVSMHADGYKMVNYGLLGISRTRH